MSIQSSLRVSLSLVICGLMLFVTLYGGECVAQTPQVFATIEPTSIRIGEQSKMTVCVAHPVGATVALSLPADTIVSGVEILRVKDGDSVQISDQLRKKIYEVTITSFDSAMYTLRNIKARVDNHLYESEEHPKLIVNTVEVDLAHPEKFYDIKAQEDFPFNWLDIVVYIYIAFAIAILGVLIYILMRCLKRRRAKQSRIPEEVYVDPYDEAVARIRTLRERESWRNTQPKEYYTLLTDILRRYIYRVWGIQTADKTSGEILESMRKVEDDRGEIHGMLTKILSTADLAKFAKYSPSSEENLSLLNAAAMFVEENKPQEAQQGDEPSQPTDSVEKSKES